ncbi:hypothetical protein [Celerinatantimonas yamalensis]|uniref:DUF4136 domain-containing protein n=1 Tax=Celerinatantimonas yamalensis TaxID=559956 RepID=A0ABW9G2X3_9GAMM
MIKALFTQLYIAMLSVFAVIALSGCVSNDTAVLTNAQDVHLLPKTKMANSDWHPQTLMVSRDTRYPLIVGSLMRFSPAMLKGTAEFKGALKQNYHWLTQELASLLNYRGFVIHSSNNATLWFAAALYHPPLQHNTDSLEKIYQANSQPVTQRQSLSILLRIYRRGAYVPLWQGAVDNYATRLPDGQIKIDPVRARQDLIRLLRTIPMKVAN